MKLRDWHHEPTEVGAGAAFLASDRKPAFAPPGSRGAPDDNSKMATSVWRPALSL